MWECGPYSDLYEDFDESWGDYEWYEEQMRQPMEFAKNNMRAFIYDVEQKISGAHIWCEFSDTGPMGGRFKFELCSRIFAGYNSKVNPEVWKMLIWMPSDRLSHIRDMGKHDGPFAMVLIDGEQLRWEEAVHVVAARITKEVDDARKAS